MTTLSLAHRVLDDGQLLPPAARWTLHCLIIHEVIGVQHCILHLHQSIIGGNALRATREAHILGFLFQGLSSYHGNPVACLLPLGLPKVKEEASRAQLPTLSGGFWVA